MKKVLRIIAIFNLVLLFTCSMAHAASSYEDVQKAIKEVAYSYYMRGPYIQYNSQKVAYHQPEESTSQKTNYMVCSGFTRNEYRELLDITIPQVTDTLIKYGKDHIGNPEVVMYGSRNKDGNVMMFYEETAPNNYITKENVTVDDVIKIVKIGDVLTYTGHTLMVYELEYDANGNVTDAVLIQSGHGSGKGYVKTKIPTKVTIGSDISFGSANHYLYHNKYLNTKFPYCREEGSLNITRLSTYTQWIEMSNKSTEKEYSILRFVHEDENGNAVLKYESIYKSSEVNHEDAIKNNELITLSPKIQERIDCPKLYIEKTVDVQNNDVVEIGDVLEYKIVVKNNSDAAYTKSLIVKEPLSKNVEFVGVVGTHSDITFTNSGSELKWNIGKLKSGEEITIRYKVKVSSGKPGTVIESIGYVGNIPSSVIKNTIGTNLTSDQKLAISSTYNELKSKYNGKELINEIYKQALGEDIGFDKFEIKDLVKNTNTKSAASSTLKLDTKNSYFTMVLNKYWGTLMKAKVDYEGSEDVYNYDLKKWGYYDASTRRADTIISKNFQTGDILLYLNSDDVTYKYSKNTLTTTSVTFEDGEYAYIYIEGMGFVGVNVGNDGKVGTKDDRNEFTPDYYTRNGLMLYSLTNETNKEFLEFANYQTLLGKDYYVILRPSLQYTFKAIKDILIIKTPQPETPGNPDDEDKVDDEIEITPTPTKITIIITTKAPNTATTNVPSVATTPNKTTTKTPNTATTKAPGVTPTRTPSRTPTRTPSRTTTQTPILTTKVTTASPILTIKTTTKTPITTPVKVVTTTSAPASNTTYYNIITRATNGRIIPDSPTLSKGSSREFTFIPNDGYEIEEIFVDGVSQGVVTEYVIKNIDRNHTIIAKFKDKNVTYWTNASDWAVEELNEAYSKKLIPETIYNKDFTTPITRKDFAAVAVKLYENITNKAAPLIMSNVFIDTNDEYVMKAYYLGITKGTSENTFSPDNNITREQIAVMLTRTLSISGVNTSFDISKVQRFADDNKFNTWGRESIYFMSREGIIKGVGNNTFSSLSNSTIEQAIAISLRSTKR